MTISFSSSRFRDPAKMIADLKQQGFHVSLWQYTYFTSKERPMARKWCRRVTRVKNDGGQLPFEDATLDLSNPEAVKWYQRKTCEPIEGGRRCHQSGFRRRRAISGQYASGRTGWYEHNLYPLRYNKAVADITKEVTKKTSSGRVAPGPVASVIHCTGAATQRTLNSAMAGELRGGLSFGLSGFTYWSHDVGGFVERAPRDLYRRWLAWGS